MTPDALVAGSEILKFAQNYIHNPNQHVVLNPYKDAVLLLRAKYATYDTITETLRANGVQVSEATVRNFCRRHQEEMKRLRSEMERKRREDNAGKSTGANAPASDSGTLKKTQDSGKPGPKIAREDF